MLAEYRFTVTMRVCIGRAAAAVAHRQGGIVLAGSHSQASHSKRAWHGRCAVATQKLFRTGVVLAGCGGPLPCAW